MKAKKSNRKGDTRLNVEIPPNMRGKTTGVGQQELHYDRSMVTNANGGGLQEVERINLQWKTLTGLYDSYCTTSLGLAFGFKRAFASLRQKLAFIL
jgi:hypothetical protein